MIFDYEDLGQPVLTPARFLRRLSVNIAFAGALTAVSLAAGMIGYHALQGLSWIDAFLNASMILSGMGPMAPLTNSAAKLFAGCYALYSGLMLIATATIIIAPVLHRLLHRLHVHDEDDDKPDSSGGA